MLLTPVRHTCYFDCFWPVNNHWVIRCKLTLQVLLETRSSYVVKHSHQTKQHNIHKFQPIIRLQSRNMLQTISLRALCLVLLIVAITYFLYVKFIKPYREYRFVCRMVSSKYKTEVEPYYLFVPNILRELAHDYQQFGDSLYTYKNRKVQVLTAPIGCSIALILYDSQLIREFYQKTSLGYYQKTTRYAFMHVLKQLMGHGVMFSEGDEWKKKRRIMSTVFNFEFIKSKIPLIAKITQEVFTKAEQTQANKGQKQIKVDLNLIFQQIFGNVVTKCFFGDIELKDIRGKSIFAFFNHMFELDMKRVFTAYAMLVGPKFLGYNLRPIDKQASAMHEEYRNYARNAINQQIQLLSKESCNKETQQQALRGKNGVIQMLVKEQKLKKTQKAEQNTGDVSREKDYYTTSDLVEEFKTFFLAGIETTSNNTLALVYQLAKHKVFQERVRKQIETVIGDDLDNITYEQLKQLKELQKCQKQALRMFSPVPELLMRQTVKDHYLGQIPVKKGTLVTVSLLAPHFKTEFYENPETFNPDRWDSTDPRKADQYAYFPFSSGQRNCIGQHLALIEYKIAVVHLLKRYKQIKPQKPEFKLYLKTAYGVQDMVTTLVK